MYIKEFWLKKNIDNCCFCCQRIILKSLGKELHHVTNMSWFSLVIKKKMQFRVCCCLFDYYVYKLSTKTTFSFTCDVCRSKDVGYPSTWYTINYFIHIYYSCRYNTIKIRRFWTKLCDHLVRFGYLTPRIFQELTIELEHVSRIWSTIWQMIILMQIMQCLFVLLNVLSIFSVISYTTIFIL